MSLDERGVVGSADETSHKQVTRRFPQIPSKGQCALMPMTLCPNGTKLWSSRSEAFMRDDGPTEQIQEAD